MTILFLLLPSLLTSHSSSSYLRSFSDGSTPLGRIRLSFARFLESPIGQALPELHMIAFLLRGRFLEFGRRITGVTYVRLVFYGINSPLMGSCRSLRSLPDRSSSRRHPTSLWRCSCSSLSFVVFGRDLQFPTRPQQPRLRTHLHHTAVQSYLSPLPSHPLSPQQKPSSSPNTPHTISQTPISRKRP
jgi:hypothetical protein